MVTASNGFLQLFSLDKNYFEYVLITCQLKLKIGSISNFQVNEDIESQRAYKAFSKSIENIKRKR